MEGYLDISGCAEKWRERFGVDRIPVRPGKHQKDLDVLEARMPGVELRKIRRAVAAVHNEAGAEWRSDWPIGFDLNAIPPGAVLHLER